MGNQNAFSLIELSIVILVLSIITVNAIDLFSINNNNAQYQGTVYKMNRIQDALIAFIAQNGRLPCPASPTQSNANVTFGVEQTATTSISGRTINTCKTTGTGIAVNALQSDNIFYGAVPAHSLGLAEEYMFDDFGNRLGYVVQQAFVNSMTTNSACITGTKAQDNNSSVQYLCYAGQLRGGKNTATNDLDIFSTYPIGNSYISRNAAYLIISHGSNGYGAYYRNADTDVDGSGANGNNADRNPLPPNSNAAEIINTSGTNQYISIPYSPIFDDIIVFENRDNLAAQCNKYSKQICTLNYNIYVLYGN